MFEKIKQYRRDLHQIPETSYNEYKTKEYLRTKLMEMGYNPIDIVKTGLYVFIDNGNDTTVAFRSDIDALDLFEENDVEFKSLHQGKMHACGHDGHMATLLGLALYLKDQQDMLKKNILLIFQPAEEKDGGAKPIVDTNILADLNVEAVFGLHLFPEFEEGIIACKSKELMAQNTEIDITIHGVSGHGAMPNTGIDAALIMSKLHLDIQNIISREISPLEYSVIHFGVMNAGSARNIVANQANMLGTIRTFNPKISDFIVNRIKKIAQGYEIAYNISIDVNPIEGYLPVINDPSLYEQLKEATKGMNFVELEKPYMISEDFSYYQAATKGLFFFVGTKNTEKGYTHPLHSCYFNFDEQALMTGLNVYINLLKTMNIL